MTTHADVAGPAPVQTGIIGCGNIAPAYIQGLRMFGIIHLLRVADIDAARSADRAKEFDIPRHGGVESLLADPDIEMVVNLTTPAHHASVNRAILEAGKHAVTEKPFALDRASGREVLSLAAAKGLRVGGAPDTFMGAGQQTVRKLVDDGWIGKPIAATATFMTGGPENWHPDPEFVYAKGGGPLLDMGPYYLTQLVHLLGPVKRVHAQTRITRAERPITSQPKFGKMMKVEVPTHVVAIVEFYSGPLATLQMSFDVAAHRHPCFELYGTEGTIAMPDPNAFGDTVRLYRQGNDWNDWKAIPFTHGYRENSRGMGPADMAYAIRSGRPHRASGQLAYHVLDVMLGIHEAGESGESVLIESTAERPAPLPPGLLPGRLDD